MDRFPINIIIYDIENAKADKLNLIAEDKYKQATDDYIMVRFNIGDKVGLKLI